MRYLRYILCFALPAPIFADESGFPQFRMQEVATDLTVGYATAIADINGDKKPDIVVVDSHRVIWYENPSWKVRTILQGKTKPDNVCLAVDDLDGDGKPDIVLGADWKPFNTKAGGTLHWLKPGKTVDDEWSMHPIGEEPTVHRVRVAHLGPKGEKCLLLGPLMGRDSTREANWMDGRPVRMLGYPIPKDPAVGPWRPFPISEELHVVHNFWPVRRADGFDDVLNASYEGVTKTHRTETGWKTVKIGAGNQANPKGNRGASEIKQGHLGKDRPYIATIEPWHGNEVVVYVPPHDPGALWDRIVLDNHLRWGHAVWCADLDGDGVEELIIGVRDDPMKKSAKAEGDAFEERRGVRIYKSADKEGRRWNRLIVDNGGMACEDLAAADLNGDGKTDIVAVGRFTKNVRIYWNEGK